MTGKMNWKKRKRRKKGKSRKERNLCEVEGRNKVVFQ
jgi:hypothetical protein